MAELQGFTGLELCEKRGAVRFAVRVQPRSSRNEIAGVIAGALKVRITAPPVDGAANEGLIAFLSSELGIAKRRISIVGGETSRSKLVEIES